jgi:tetratricopeptide (TPR) repeat protein
VNRRVKLSTYLRAIELNQHYASAHHWHAWLLMASGRMDEAAASIKRAPKLDPGSLMINAVLGLPLYFARRFESAGEQYLETLEMNPEFTQARYYLAMSLTH